MSSFSLYCATTFELSWPPKEAGLARLTDSCLKANAEKNIFLFQILAASSFGTSLATFNFDPGQVYSGSQILKATVLVARIIVDLFLLSGATVVLKMFNRRKN